MNSQPGEMKAVDLIGAGERALVIYTDGRGLVIEDNGDGQTGNWVIRRNVRVDSVILYHLTPHGIEVYKGAFAGVIGEVGHSRRVIGFSGLQHVGHTNLTWPQFAGGGANPIRYVSRV